jgi:hypothetical protein
MLGTRLGIIEPASFSTFAFSAFHAFTHLQIIINNPKCNDKLNLNYNTDSEISKFKTKTTPTSNVHTIPCRFNPTPD